MAIPWYLALSRAEISTAKVLPEFSAWLDCSFSSTDRGLTGLPETISEKMLLVITDRNPPEDHDAAMISEQLKPLILPSSCPGVLLDFQGCSPKHRAMAESLASSLPCSVIISKSCRAGKGPVFLPPCPHHIPLKDHLAQCPDHPLWLDLAPDAQSITVNTSGASISPVCVPAAPGIIHADPALHCHYSISVAENAVDFTFWRTKEDLQALAREAESLGVTAVMSLYQELS